MEVKRVGGKLVLGLTTKEKAKKEKADLPLLALKEMQQYLMKKDKAFMPKYKL